MWAVRFIFMVLKIMNAKENKEERQKYQLK